MSRGGGLLPGNGHGAARFRCESARQNQRVDRCPRSSTPCRNRYDRIVATDGRPVELDGYVPGEPTVDPFRIVAPRGR